MFIHVAKHLLLELFLCQNWPKNAKSTCKANWDDFDFILGSVDHRLQKYTFKNNMPAAPHLSSHNSLVDQALNLFLRRCSLLIGL